ncbi:hypothetical protein A2W14_01930 [Candidatus Gottesmanbacteria bacterium RBG_16_37_8]|uniref:DUF2029 domain-containing protein n=1 Tax=Candidatus Gottesmanbacteria bacterium RBG_16_37_8 TaxID=1798371 RepID=A0A1F5YW43_9BACT|nr:MAG: hypothetical protein A2W14_01930 [Candidatus Gottesmanbacteria bacterium RBG_16_37_8]
MLRTFSLKTIKNVANDIPSILLLGLIIRLIIGTFTINWDFLRITQISLKYFSGGLMEVYRDPLSVYPVLTYWTRIFFIFISKPFLSGSFYKWNSNGDLSIIADTFIFRNLFFLKLPFILIEIATAYIFAKLLPRAKRGLFLLMWMINPIALYTIAAFTNVDVFPLFFIAVCLYFLNKKKGLLCSFFLGISAAYKIFPILLLPFLLFSQNNWKQRIYQTLIFLIPFVGTQIPALSISLYWKNSLTASANRLILNSTLNIGNNKLLILFIVIYCLLFFFYLTEKNRESKTPLYFFLALSVIFTVSAFNIQWVYWILPLIILHQLYFREEKIISFVLYAAYFGIIFLSQTALHIGMLSPVDPSLWTLDKPLTAFIGSEINLLINSFYSLFAAAVIFLSYRVYKVKGDDTFNNEKA